jgi:hypothetical protein
MPTATLYSFPYDNYCGLSPVRLFLLILMMEEAALCDSNHDYKSWIGSSSPTSMLDFSKASSRLMTLLILDSDSKAEVVIELGTS